MNYLELDPAKINIVFVSLNKLLADYQLYYQNLRAFHWNVQGKIFFELHEVFEDLYNDAKVNIDDVAERILTLRCRPLTKFTEYLKITDIAEAEPVVEDHEMVSEILRNHKQLISDMRSSIAKASEISDEGTVDLISSMLGAIEKKSWMLDAWLNK